MRPFLPFHAAPSRDPLLQFAPRLRRYARVLVAESESVDALVRATFARGPGEGLPPEADRCAALFAVMHKLSCDRTLPDESAEGHSDAAPVRDDASRRAGNGTDTAGAVDALTRVMGELPRQDREVLLLVAVERMSYRTVASILDVPIGTVMSRLGRARDRLRAAGRAADEARTR